MKLAQPYNDFVATKGVNLEPYESSRLALSKDDALNAIKLLRNAEIPILGGDVYVRKGKDVKILPIPFWSYKDQEGETWQGYVKRTLDKSEEFIRTYPNAIDGELLFVIVPLIDEVDYLLKKHSYL